MAGALVGGAMLGAPFGEILKVVVQQTKKTAKFKTHFKRLVATLERIKPVIDDIKKSSDELNHPEEQMRMFIDYLTKGKELILKCPKIKFWNVLDKYVYANKLIRLDNELLRVFQIDVPIKLMSNSMKTLVIMEDLTDKMDVLSTATIRAGGFIGLCGVPGLPELVIGLDHHLYSLKNELLKDDTRVLVISATGGSGKTTLAKTLCHDKEITGIFGKNILYITVSRPSSLKMIVQKIFEHHGIKRSSFQNDEEAKNQLESLFRHLGSGKMLLVLDDVWPESESLVEDLNFKIRGFKILVTSRFSFKRFSSYDLTLLNDDHAKTLFCYSAFPDDGVSVNVRDDLVNKMVKVCKGLPLALKVIGASLCGQPALKWQTTLKRWSDGQSVFESNEDLLLRLQTSIDALDELPIVKKCFLDLGSFPEDDQITGTTLMDMWVELYNLDNEGMYASENLLELSSRNLVNLVPVRRTTGEIEGYCSEHYVTQHDLLRELAIHLSSQEPVPQRERLFIEIDSNSFPIWWSQQTEQPINARILSISTDESFNSTWYDLNVPNVEVVILNIRSKKFTLPKFIEKMSQLKILIVTGYGNYPTQLHNLSLIGSLPNLKRIRFKHVSFSSPDQHKFTTQNLIKLSFVMCELDNVLQSGIIQSPYITDLEIDSCYDLKQLPTGLGKLVNLLKLTVTNCHELQVLPTELSKLLKLKNLRLHCCTKLQELPESIGSLHDLSLLDISDCLNISALPEQMGELSRLGVLIMSGCRGLQELPVSMRKLQQLKDVICDEETSYLWNAFESDDICNVKINIVEEDRVGSFNKILH
ncbi:probable disease resistance protein At5g66900 [Rutidosis leptorrhynchoides]|uniref:probable disease resistance protein At5g66900 n=1 Tax=Rutidosis leptorrhynchoides TaxID=125765 RepID=UPI003A9A4E44